MPKDCMNRFAQVSGRRIRLLLVSRTASVQRKLALDESLKLELREDQQIFAQGFATCQPDVVLFDATLPEASCRALLGVTSTPAIILGSADLDHYVIPCLIAGARGHLDDKGVPGQVRE